MSIDRSLKVQSSLARHRNVLSRAERVARLKQQERWTEDMGAIHLPKVGNRKLKTGKKSKKKGGEEE
jgi:small basic protein (TIGR04137 family)